jgi:hypothetical protein
MRAFDYRNDAFGLLEVSLDMSFGFLWGVGWYPMDFFLVAAAAADYDNSVSFRFHCSEG